MIEENSFHLVSLGCAKNMVDSEVILGSLQDAGFTYVETPDMAEFLVINTCGFLQSAVEEGIDEILALAEHKKTDERRRLIVVGCMVQRYREQLVAELPEVDLFVGTEAPHRIGNYLQALGGSQKNTGVLKMPDSYLMDSSSPRMIATPPFRAWLKITEGCDNRCSYCMIPHIRGGLRSRPIDDLVKEARNLELQGVKELSIIGQDITAFGRDKGLRDGNLIRLLEALLEKTEIPWIRLLYLYPSGINRELLELIRLQQRILPYLDLPIQHVSDRVLKAMNRHYTKSELLAVMDMIRELVPEMAIRTTLLVGFPGEEEEDVMELERFLGRYKLDHVGVFAYENEEGSVAWSMENQIDESERIRRRDWILQCQAEISREKLRRYVGTTQQVLVEGTSPETDLLLAGRTRFQAPEVDGIVYINEGEASAGELRSVRIVEAHTYDLVGHLLPR